ncbi:MAG: hypothetical protein ACLSD6_08380 [Clostridium sp.]
MFMRLIRDSVISCPSVEFFPGKQYTPSDFNEKSVTGGTFLTLGSFGNFSLGSTSEASNGTATYRLTLSLPDTARTYSLYLPEIFSAYTLYLNEEKVCSQGNPDPAHYQDLIGNKEISFTASGTVHITIIVTNYSHIYSGITIHRPLEQLLPSRNIFLQDFSSPALRLQPFFFLPPARCSFSAG